MAKAVWAVRCTAHRTSGVPCSAWSVKGAFVCVTHGGAIGHVREAAARRWSRELLARKTERDAELRLGRPLDDFERGLIRYWAKGDIATYRQHVRTRDADPA